MPHHCIYCGREIKRDVKGRPATAEQLQQASEYHHPHPVTATYICDTHRRYGPTTTPQKRRHRSSLGSSDSSSLDSASKRRHTAQILSSLSQPHVQQQTTSTVCAGTCNCICIPSAQTQIKASAVACACIVECNMKNIR